MTSGVAQRPPKAEQSHLVPRQCDCFAWFLVAYWSDRNECETCWINPKAKEPRT